MSRIKSLSGFNLGQIIGFSCALLTLLLTGCKSDYGPRFDPRATAAAIPGVAGPVESPSLEVAEGVFLPVNEANRIEADMLVAPTQPFQLGPGDLIEIEMLDQAGSRAATSVGPDGKIYYNLLPGVFVWGLTLSETKSVLTNEFARFLRSAPQVSIRLRGVGSKRVWVLGNVQTPGVYGLATPATVLEVLALAGGPVGIGGQTQDLTDLRNSFVMRKGAMLKLDLAKLLNEGDLSQNIYLQPDDFLYLRPTVGKTIYVMGAVTGPGPQALTQSKTLASALAGAGGLAPYAYGAQVAIVRGSLNRPTIALVNYREILRGKATDVELLEGDIVFVPFSPFRRLQMLGEEILSQFVRTMAINEGTRAVNPDAAVVSPSVPLNFAVP